MHGEAQETTANEASTRPAVPDLVLPVGADVRPEGLLAHGKASFR